MALGTPLLCRLSELIAACSVPELAQDIEDNPIDRGNFEEFTQSLEIHIPVLLDTISDPDLITELCAEDDSTLAELRTRIVILMCQYMPVQEGVWPPYSPKEEHLWKHLHRICTAHLMTRTLLSDTLSAFKNLLLDNKWKRNIGACFGFVGFCGLLLESPDTDHNDQTILFILSIASQFIDCIHGEIKLLGLRLYWIIVKHCPRKSLLDSNIHKVIIKNCLDNCQRMLPEECVLLLWECVTEALILDDRGILGDLKWNELDDSLHLMFQKIKLESKREVRQQLRRLLKRITIACLKNEEVVGLLKDSDKLKVQEEINLKQLKNEKMFRWITDLKELFIFECLSVSNSPDSTTEVLQFITEMYLLTMTGLGADIIYPTLIDMIKRLTPLLLEIHRIYKDHLLITEIIRQLLCLIAKHASQISRPEDTQGTNYQLALQQLISASFAPTLEARSE